MFGYYTPILALQAFCLYHAYKINGEQKWFWLIIFFPLVGCVIYLYQELYSRRSAEHLFEVAKGMFNSNYNINKLEKALQFTDTITNKINLANAYMAAHRPADAIPLYKSCLESFKANDPIITIKLLIAYYEMADYKQTIKYGQQLSKEKVFERSEAKIAYASALYQDDKIDEAEAVFKSMDSSYTNYPHRIAYCQFLAQTDRSVKAKQKAEEMLNEFQHMGRLEQKQFTKEWREAKNIYRSL
jgi:hypothetical protein